MSIILALIEHLWELFLTFLGVKVLYLADRMKFIVAFSDVMNINHGWNLFNQNSFIPCKPDMRRNTFMAFIKLGIISCRLSDWRFSVSLILMFGFSKVQATLTPEWYEQFDFFCFKILKQTSLVPLSLSFFCCTSRSRSLFSPILELTVYWHWYVIHTS